MAVETVPAGAAGTPNTRYKNPVYELGRTAFDLWALLRAVSARIDELSNVDELDDEHVSEVLRLIGIGSRMAHDIGVAACDMPYPCPSVAQGAAA